MPKKLSKTNKTAGVRVSTKKAPKDCGKVACHDEKHGANHAAQTARLNRMIGQLQGIGRMIDAQRYCPEILIQTRAVISAIRSLEGAILEEHLRHCVKEAFLTKQQTDSEAIIQEIVELYASRS